MQFLRKGDTNSKEPEVLQCPSMHIIPLNPHTRMPTIFATEGGDSMPAITTDGRLSFLPVEGNIGQVILARIEDRYPKEGYSGVQSYVCVADALQAADKKEIVFIFQVWGFWEPMEELEHLYHRLLSLQGKRVGDEFWVAVEKDLSSDPIKSWINNLIEFLKGQLDWKGYVDSAGRAAGLW